MTLREREILKERGEVNPKEPCAVVVPVQHQEQCGGEQNERGLPFPIVQIFFS